MDAGVVCLGEPNGFPIALNSTAPWADPDIENFGLSSVLFNNLWGTNYVMWQPYQKASKNVAGEESYGFRFDLVFS
jgi:hypothetical protein